jgi:hypothetical protein
MVALAVWREAVRQSADDAFGIHAAEPDPGLCEVLERHMRELLEKLPRATSLIDRVRQQAAPARGGSARTVRRDVLEARRRRGARVRAAPPSTWASWAS